MELAHTIYVPDILNHNNIDTFHKAVMQAADAEESVVVLQGMNDKIFCRGVDINSFGDKYENNTAYMYAECLLSLHTLAKPVIAIVRGESLGGGNGIAAASDVLIATEDARFGLPEGLFGLVPAVVMVMLEERMLPQKIRAWALSCATVSATEVHRIGLVDKVVEAESLQKSVELQIKNFNRCSPESVSYFKTRQRTQLQQRLQAAAQETTERLQSDEVKRRIECWQQGGAPWGRQWQR